MVYYSILLVIGNDIMPSNMAEYVYCILVLILGAFLEAYIIGGITTEIAKTKDIDSRSNKLKEYVRFSLDMHNFPDRIKQDIFRYMTKVYDKTNIEC